MESKNEAMSYSWRPDISKNYELGILENVNYNRWNEFVYSNIYEVFEIVNI